MTVFVSIIVLKNGGRILAALRSEKERQRTQETTSSDPSSEFGTSDASEVREPSVLPVDELNAIGGSIQPTGSLHP
jgi:hypothetical protein